MLPWIELILIVVCKPCSIISHVSYSQEGDHTLKTQASDYILIHSNDYTPMCPQASGYTLMCPNSLSQVVVPGSTAEVLERGT